MRPTLVFVLLCFGLAVSWDNQWHEALHKVCPYGYSFYQVYSYFSSSQKDRRYTFNCGRNVVSSHICYWSKYLNKIGSTTTYYCKSNYVMTGVFGHYDFRKQDRRFKFKCCKQVNSRQKFCEWTPYPRCPKAYHENYLARDRVCRGMQIFYYGRGDRQLRPYICRI